MPHDTCSSIQRFPPQNTKKSSSLISVLRSCFKHRGFTGMLHWQIMEHSIPNIACSKNSDQGSLSGSFSQLETASLWPYCLHVPNKQNASRWLYYCLQIRHTHVLQKAWPQGTSATQCLKGPQQMGQLAAAGLSCLNVLFPNRARESMSRFLFKTFRRSSNLNYICKKQRIDLSRKTHQAGSKRPVAWWLRSRPRVRVLGFQHSTDF